MHLPVNSKGVKVHISPGNRAASGLRRNFPKYIFWPRRGGQIQQQDVEALPTHVLVNSKGVEVHISPVGAAIERLNVPDRSGRLTDIVLGFDKKTPYAVSSDV